MPDSLTTLEGTPGEPENRIVSSQQLSILLQRAIGAENIPNFTEAQINEILSQRRELVGYVHKDKKQESWDDKFYLIAVLIFIILLSGGVLIFKPDLFSQVLSFLAGLFGGGLGGYGLAKTKN